MKIRFQAEGLCFQSRLRGFPAGLLDRAFDARVRLAKDLTARFNGLKLKALAVMRPRFISKAR
jgi:hypothetical protein